MELPPRSGDWGVRLTLAMQSSVNHWTCLRSSAAKQGAWIRLWLHYLWATGTNCLKKFSYNVVTPLITWNSLFINIKFSHSFFWYFFFSTQLMYVGGPIIIYHISPALLITYIILDKFYTVTAKLKLKKHGQHEAGPSSSLYPILQVVFKSHIYELTALLSWVVTDVHHHIKRRSSDLGKCLSPLSTGPFLCVVIFPISGRGELHSLLLGWPWVCKC